MYEAFFGFRERPFDLSPSPRFLVLTDSHREALSNLEYGIARRMGVTLLLGEAGSGKTTVIRAAIEARPDRVHCIHLSNPTLSRQEFNEMIARNFGLSSRAAGSKAVMLAELEALLKQRLQRDETSVLVLDEAQSMPGTLLEEVRLLANIETNDTKLLSIVVAGQPELADRLNEHELRQLKQRVALRCDIRPLSLDETNAYVTARIHTAGGVARVFTPDAIAVLHKAARGLPRTINVIADNALLGAFGAGRTTVDADLVHGICRDFDLEAGGLPSSTYFDEITPGAVSLAETRRPSDDVATLPVPQSAKMPLLPVKRGVRQAFGYSTAAAATVAIVFAISAGILGRGVVGQPVPAGRTPDSTVLSPVTRPVDSPVARPSVAKSMVPPASGATRRGNNAPPAPAETTRTVDRPQAPPRRAEIRTVNAASSGPVSPAVSRPADRVAAPPARSAVVPQPAPSVAANTAASVSPAPRREDPSTSDARRGGEPATTVQASMPVSPATEPPVTRAAASAPVSALPAGSIAGADRTAPSSASNAVEPPIQSVLDQYRHAFGTLTASGVERFWPSVNTKNLQRAFDQIDSQRIEFDSCVTSATTASRAQVSCGGSATFVPRVGNKTPRVESRRWTFHLSRANAAWIIERVESR